MTARQTKPRPNRSTCGACTRTVRAWIDCGPLGRICNPCYEAADATLRDRGPKRTGPNTTDELAELAAKRRTGRTGTCTGCGQSKILRADGRITGHKQCPGAYQLPADAEPIRQL